jgi:hypothetical protein
VGGAVAPRGLELQDHLAVVGAAAHSGMQAETVDVGAQVLLEVRIPGHHALHSG